MTISQIFNQISTTAGINDKMALMQQNLNDTIKLIYKDTYDSSRKYGVHKYTITSNGTLTVDANYDQFHDLLDQLAARKLTGNAAIDAVSSLISKFTVDDQAILAAVLDKKLTIGLSYTSFVKLTGEKANDFAVTLACHLDGVKGVNPVDGTWYASRKCDGCVSGDTIVEFENGLKMPISEVVNNRMKGKIKSFDEKTNQIVYKEIEDWMHNVEDIDKSQKQWYEIELDDGKILKITGNDSLYVNGKGWTRVDELTEDDEILVELEITFTKIKSIKKIASEDTYELTVKDTHCFYCNGILKHNCRVVALVDKQIDTIDVKFISRQGKEFTTLDNVKPGIKWLVRDLPVGRYVFDGEGCIVDQNGDEDFQSILKQIRKKDWTIENPCYQIFDFVTEDEFLGYSTSANFTDRYKKMTDMIQGNTFNTIKILKQELLKSQADFDRWENYVSVGNWEGFMLRKDEPFKTGRIKTLLKVKKFDDAEYEVKDIEISTMTTAEPGVGNVTYEGVRALLIDYEGYTVRVGSGLTKEQRIAWKNDPSKILGKTICVKYFETTTNQNGTKSLRFPILKYVYENGRGDL